MESPPTPTSFCTTVLHQSSIQCFWVTEGLSLMKNRKRKERTRKEYLIGTWIYQPILAMVWLSSEDVFTMFYHPIFFRVCLRKCELDGKQEKMWLGHLSRAALSSCHKAHRWCLHPPSRERFIKGWINIEVSLNWLPPPCIRALIPIKHLPLNPVGLSGFITDLWNCMLVALHPNEQGAKKAKRWRTKKET